MTSKGTLVWAFLCKRRDSRHEARQASSLRAGTITDTVGRAETGNIAGIRRIHYYSRVRRLLRFAGAIAAIIIILLLSGCYGRSRPSRIGSAAPDFTVHDSARTVTLSQFKGQVVVL